MSLIHYNPARTTTQGVNRFFDDIFGDNFFNTDAVQYKSFVPQVDISETDKAFELQFALPGFKKSDIKVDLNQGVLTVSGERKFEEKKDGKNYHAVETRYGSFKRAYQLPDSINDEQLDAKYEDGILNILVPKDVKKVQQKTIAVK
ncbi:MULTISPECIES: Hsp20/alpha crystallin family protein [Reichenbachiella]|uniref:Hsp20/alpha crystallin family protein n=1 Tax=Reichenbachiella TaxID=156993 RepID=UPI000E6D40EE|nr:MULTISPECIES: Hsp20/alpha crystallin family protein [Reichenbachiella]MBU2915951.1 Hsp20/alpha crystallin family protein [Reichenbachiella agariperforans]RJE71793.1 heat-shock protein Hsp20 [Reichenbachiella sp. MSK19-1]